MWRFSAEWRLWAGDGPGLGPRGHKPWGFESLRPHHRKCLQTLMGAVVLGRPPCLEGKEFVLTGTVDIRVTDDDRFFGASMNSGTSSRSTPTATSSRTSSPFRSRS